MTSATKRSVYLRESCPNISSFELWHSHLLLSGCPTRDQDRVKEYSPFHFLCPGSECLRLCGLC